MKLEICIKVSQIAVIFSANKMVISQLIVRNLVKHDCTLFDRYFHNITTIFNAKELFLSYFIQFDPGKSWSSGWIWLERRGLGDFHNAALSFMERQQSLAYFSGNPSLIQFFAMQKGIAKATFKGNIWYFPQWFSQDPCTYQFASSICMFESTCWFLSSIKIFDSSSKNPGTVVILDVQRGTMECLWDYFLREYWRSICVDDLL